MSTIFSDTTGRQLIKTKKLATWADLIGSNRFRPTPDQIRADQNPSERFFTGAEPQLLIYGAQGLPWHLGGFRCLSITRLPRVGHLERLVKPKSSPPDAVVPETYATVRS
jgi:hypothetical protein